jgi:biotin carboxyl carrier protein
LTFSPSQSDKSGTVVEILVEDGKPVSIDTVCTDKSIYA